jgi:rod shape-determining protein MreC
MYRRTGRGRLLLLIFLALSIVLITLDFRQNEGGPLERLKDISSAVVAPIQRGLAAVARPVGDFFSAIGDIGELRDENERLTEELEQAQTEIDEAEAVKDQLQRLTALNDLDDPWVTMEKLTAEVIARSSSNYRWAYIINKGRSDGVRPDMAVIDSDGLVGKVLSVSSHEATIIVLIDPESSVTARVADERDTGSLRGNGANEPLDLQLISPESDVDEGDAVITAGYDRGIYPPGIPIGFVSEVGPEGAELEADVEVEPYVDFTKLDFVYVLLESGPRLAGNEQSKGAASGQ